MLAKTPRSSSVFSNSLARMSSFSASSRTVMPSVTVTARGSRCTGATGSTCAARPAPDAGARAHRMKLALAFGKSLFDERAPARGGRLARIQRLCPAPPSECRHRPWRRVAGCRWAPDPGADSRAAAEILRWRRPPGLRWTAGPDLTWRSRRAHSLRRAGPIWPGPMVDRDAPEIGRSLAAPAADRAAVAHPGRLPGWTRQRSPLPGAARRRPRAGWPWRRSRRSDVRVGRQQDVHAVG